MPGKRSSVALRFAVALSLLVVLTPAAASAEDPRVIREAEASAGTISADGLTLEGAQAAAAHQFMTARRLSVSGVSFVNVAENGSVAANPNCAPIGPMPTELGKTLPQIHVLFICAPERQLAQVNRDSWDSGGSAAGAATYSSGPVNEATKEILEARPGVTCTPYRGIDVDLNDGARFVCTSTAAGLLGSTAVAAIAPSLTQYEPHTFVPAWRWRQHTDLLSAPGFFDGAINVPINALAGLLFIIAGWIWGLLLFVLREATSLDVLAKNAEQINEAFSVFAVAIQRSGAWIVVMLMAVFIAARMVLSGRLTRVFSLAAGVIIPVALLFALTAATANAPRDRTELPIGSPAWIGVKGVQMVDQVGNAAAEGLWGTNQLVLDRTSAEPQADGTACDAYRKQLGELERQRMSLKGLERLDANSMLLVSRMWETSFLNSWMAAQYGSVDAGSRMYCFDLEARLTVPPAEQAKILKDATGGRLDLPVGAFQDTSPDDTDARARIYMFAACSPDPATGAVAAQPGWAALKGPSQSDCEAWASSSGRRSGEPTGLNWSTTRALNDARREAGGTGNNDIAFAYNTVRATWGHNGGQRITEGLVAVITAAVYLYALGAVSVGAIMAQYGLFLMLILSPVTLVLVALPSGAGGRNPTGVRMLKMTGGFFFAKMALTLVLSLLVVTSTLLGSLIPARAGGQLGVGSMISLAHAFVPLVSLFLVRKLLTTLGLGDITKLSGAVGLSAATAAAATGDSRIRNSMAKGLTENRAAQALSRADARFKKAVADRTTARAAAAAKKAAAGTKRAWRESDTRARMDPLLGRKDEDGNVVAESAWARTKAGARARKAEALAKGLGWATGANVGEEGSKNRVQEALSKSKVARQAYENHLGKSLGAREAHTLMRQRTQSLKEENAAVRGATASERPAKLQELVDKRIAGAASANLAAMREDAKDPSLYNKDSGLFNAEERQSMVNAMYARHGIRNPEALAANVLSSEEGLAPMVVSAQGRRGPGGSVTGRFDGMQLSPSEAYSVLKSNPEMMFPPEVLRRRPGESESQQHARLMALSIAAGYRDANGVPVDFLAMNGMTKETAERELAKALQGQESKLDFMTAHLDPQAVAQVEAGMLARNATNKRTGEVSAADKMVQVTKAKEELEEVTGTVQTVQEQMMNLARELSGDNPDFSRVGELLGETGSGLEAAYDGMMSATATGVIYEHDVSNRGNMAEAQAEINQRTAPLESGKTDVLSRVEKLKTLSVELTGYQQTIREYQGYSAQLKTHDVQVQQVRSEADSERAREAGFRAAAEAAEERGRAAARAQEEKQQKLLEEAEKAEEARRSAHSRQILLRSEIQSASAAGRDVPLESQHELERVVQEQQQAEQRAAEKRAEAERAFAAAEAARLAARREAQETLEKAELARSAAAEKDGETSRLLEDPDRKAVVAELAQRESEYRNAEAQLAAGQRTLDKEMGLLGKAGVGPLTKQANQIASEERVRLDRAYTIYSATAGVEARNSDSQPNTDPRIPAHTPFV